jgi:PAS domain-containing protein
MAGRLARRYPAFVGGPVPHPADDAGKPVSLTGVNIDITARKQAETALRASEAKFRWLFDSNVEPRRFFLFSIISATLCPMHSVNGAVHRGQHRAKTLLVMPSSHLDVLATRNSDTNQVIAVTNDELAALAHTAVHELEALHRAITGILAVRGGARIGGSLGLRWHAEREYLEWMQRTIVQQPRNPEDPDGEAVAYPLWRYVGVRLPDEIRKTLRARTLGRVDAIEGMMQLKREAVSALRAIDHLLQYAAEWPSAVIDVQWSGGPRGRTTWVYPLEGSPLRSRTYPLEGTMPPTAAGAEGPQLLVTLKSFLSKTGPRVAALEECLIAPLAAVETRLAVLAEQCKAPKDDWQRRGLRRPGIWPRLYPVRTRAAWTVRDFRFSPKVTTVHLSLDELQARLPRLAPMAQQVLGEVHELLVRRAAARRLLWLLTDFGQAARLLPAGVWTIRGHAAHCKRMDWYVNTTRDGRALYKPCRKESTESLGRLVTPDETEMNESLN